MMAKKQGKPDPFSYDSRKNSASVFNINKFKKKINFQEESVKHMFP